MTGAGVTLADQFGSGTSTLWGGRPVTPQLSSVPGSPSGAFVIGKDQSRWPASSALALNDGSPANPAVAAIDGVAPRLSGFFSNWGRTAYAAGKQRGFNGDPGETGLFGSRQGKGIPPQQRPGPMLAPLPKPVPPKTPIQSLADMFTPAPVKKPAGITVVDQLRAKGLTPAQAYAVTNGTRENTGQSGTVGGMTYAETIRSGGSYGS